MTGGAQGIGRAIVEKFLAEGARTAFCDIDIDTGMRTRAELSRQDPESVVFVPGDVSNESDVARFAGEAISALGGLDVLVNNAGINAYHDAVGMTEDEWDRVFSVDLKGAWLCCKYTLPAMRAAGGGSIVNIGSIHARLTTGGMFPYAAAKSGLLGMTRSLALDVGVDRVRVNAVCPGWTRTTRFEEYFRHQTDPRVTEESVLATHPLGRIGTPEEMANVVAFVASDEASFVTGTAIYVDGGLGSRYA